MWHNDIVLVLNTYTCITCMACTCMVPTRLQIKYKRVHLESSNIYKEQLKEFYEKYPDAKELLKRYATQSLISPYVIMFACRKRTRKDSGSGR